MAEPSAKQKKENPRHKRVLIIDDDEAIRHMLQVAIETEGFSTQTARDGRSLSKILSVFQPHLIVSDVMMPGGGGYEVLRMIQAEPVTRNTPVILISGHGFDASTKQMLKQEGNVIEFFDKPIRPFKFITRIHQELNTLTKEEQRAQEQSQQSHIDMDRYGGGF